MLQTGLNTNYIRSTSAARNHALVLLLIFTLYHCGDCGSSGVAMESIISTDVPSCMVTTLSLEFLGARGAELSCVPGTTTTAVS